MSWLLARLLDRRHGLLGLIRIALPIFTEHHEEIVLLQISAALVISETLLELHERVVKLHVELLPLVDVRG